MNRYKVEELVDGMQFSAPVYIDEESLLVPEGVAVRDKDIERLKRWGVEELRTEGHPVLEAPLEEQIDAISEGVSSHLLDVYSEAVEIMDLFFYDAQQGLALQADPIDQIMNKHYPELRDGVENAMGLTFRKMDTRNRYSASAINCMILSIGIGQKLKLPGHRLMNLAQGALLHDIGMTRIPHTILNKNGSLTETEMKSVQAHTVHSYRMITKELGLSEEVGRIVLLHHERWDGKGYPKGFTGKEIPISARIVSVADAYEAMIRERPYRGSMIGYKAVRQVLNDNGRRYDSEILKLFIKSMGVYPPGSIVILNEGSVGKVVKNHRDVPLRPVVQIMVSGDGEKISTAKQKKMDLLKEADMFIARAVHPNEIGT
jgi:HD-GYP domain-containing protein (c-di-GMP phosphodiesterase class II)